MLNNILNNAKYAMAADHKSNLACGVTIFSGKIKKDYTFL